MENLIVRYYVEDTPYATRRLFLRLPEYAELFDTWRLLFDFTLAPISIWGAADKSHEIKDGSQFVSYEYNLNVTVEHLTIALNRAVAKLNEDLSRFGKRIELAVAEKTEEKVEVWGK